MPVPPSPDASTWHETLKALRSAVQQGADAETLLAGLDTLEKQGLTAFPREEGSAAQGLQTLYTLARDVIITLDVNQSLENALKTLVNLTQAERGLIILLDESGAPRPRFMHVPAHLTGKRADLSFSQSIVQETLQQARPVLTQDAQLDPRFSGRDSVILQGLRSVLCLPLIALGRPLGVVYLEQRNQAGFTRVDLEALTLAVEVVALAITQAQKYQLLQQRLNARQRDLNFLGDMQQALSKDYNYPRLLRQSLSWALRAVGAAGGALGTLQAGGLRWQVQEGGNTAAPEVAHQVLQQRRPLLEAQRLVLPLVHAGHPVGILVLQAGSSTFNESQFALAQHVAALIALFLENARLYEDLRQAQETHWTLVQHLLQSYQPALHALEAGEANAPRWLRRIWENQRLFALLEQSRYPLVLLPIKLRPPLEAALEACRAEREARALHFELDLPDTLPTVLADSDALTQVFIQLLRNAIAYTPDRGRVYLHVDPLPDAPDRLLCTLEDTGYGIALAEQERLFTPFFRSQDPRVQAMPGSGLGLAIVKRLVEIHGGRVGFRSLPGEGSVFFFTLPIADRENR